MTILTDHARTLLARALCGRSPVLPAQVFAALGTGGSLAAGLTGEPATAGYARQRVTFTGTAPQRNADPLRYSFAGAAGTLSHFGLFDAPAGGNPLAFAPLATAVTVSGPGVVTLAADTLTVGPE
jgi:hypothetical protein